MDNNSDNGKFTEHGEFLHHHFNKVLLEDDINIYLPPTNSLFINLPSSTLPFG